MFVMFFPNILTNPIISKIQRLNVTSHFRTLFHLIDEVAFTRVEMCQFFTCRRTDDDEHRNTAKMIILGKTHKKDGGTFFMYLKRVI